MNFAFSCMMRTHVLWSNVNKLALIWKRNNLRTKRNSRDTKNYAIIPIQSGLCENFDMPTPPRKLF